MRGFKLILLSTAFLCSAISALGVTLVGSVIGVADQGLRDVTVSMRGIASCQTSSTGVFALALPDSWIGQQIQLDVQKEGWRVRDAAQLTLVVPRNPAQFPSKIKMLPIFVAASDGVLGFNYMRLHGAGDVWQVLTAMTGDVGAGFGPFGNSADPEKLDRFFKKFEYRNAAVLEGPVLSEVKNANPVNIYQISAENDPKAQAFIDWWSFVGGAPGDDQLKAERKKLTRGFSETEMRTAIEARSQNVAYLFLIFENTSSRRLTDVTFSSAEILRPDWPSPYPTSLKVEQALQKAPVVRQTLPQLAPGQSAMLLLAVYFRDLKGYPDRYISSVIRPQSVAYKIDGHEVKQLVRPPLMDKAIRVLVPFGWYAQ